jgi:hypothetical protein
VRTFPERITERGRPVQGVDGIISQPGDPDGIKGEEGES